MPINQDVRARLLAQKASMDRGGLFLDNKNITRIVLRILPGRDGTPGTESHEVYSRSLEKGTTSPRTFGLPCPAQDYLDKAYKSLSKDDYKELQQQMKITTKYVMVVLDMADPGTTESPNLRLFQAPTTLYEQIIAYMIDEEDGEDITDYETGRAVVVKKEGTGLDTKWTCKFNDRAPLSDDPEFVTAVQAAMENMDVSRHIFKVDWAKLGEIYRAATGDEIPPEYQDGSNEGGIVARPAPASAKPAPRQAAAAPARPAPAKPAPAPAARPAAAPAKPAGPAKPAAAPAKPAPAKPAPAKPAPAPAPAPKPVPRPAPKPTPPPPADEAADSNGIVLNVTRVSFTADSGEMTGTVVQWNGDSNYAVKDDTDGSEWNMDLADMTILEAEVTQAAADEPTETETPVDEQPADEPPPAPVRRPGPVKPGAAAPRLAARRPN